MTAHVPTPTKAHAKLITAPVQRLKKAHDNTNGLYWRARLRVDFFESTTLNRAFYAQSASWAWLLDFLQEDRQVLLFGRLRDQQIFDQLRDVFKAGHMFVHVGQCNGLANWHTKRVNNSWMSTSRDKREHTQHRVHNRVANRRATR